jgi:hypothetical protein
MIMAYISCDAYGLEPGRRKLPLNILKTNEAIAKPFVIPECLYREYGFSSS